MTPELEIMVSGIEASPNNGAETHRDPKSWRTKAIPTHGWHNGLS